MFLSYLCRSLLEEERERERKTEREREIGRDKEMYRRRYDKLANPYLKMHEVRESRAECSRV